jgi:hypothetical protein
MLIRRLRFDDFGPFKLIKRGGNVAIAVLRPLPPPIHQWAAGPTTHPADTRWCCSRIPIVHRGGQIAPRAGTVTGLPLLSLPSLPRCSLASLASYPDELNTSGMNSLRLCTPGGRSTTSFLQPASTSPPRPPGSPPRASQTRVRRPHWSISADMPPSHQTPPGQTRLRHYPRPCSHCPT